ncbi:hypothetical protein CDAR_399471 [Caerostris darwini]|uniref:Uncharacterized protein n=1 Tax=Caerostris darwini TaxID=1538125 RepID=A0AAV4SZX9_9ARAC|nr:hypothetical protein CDAR_399471 [Caerostris darwini]
MIVSVSNFKTKVRVAVLCAKSGSCDDNITDAIDGSLDSKNRDYKTVSAVPCEKARHRMADPPEDDDPRLECGPDSWNIAAQIDWEGDGYPF